MNGNSGAHCKAAPERPLSGPRGAVALAAVHPYFLSCHAAGFLCLTTSRAFDLPTLSDQHPKVYCVPNISPCLASPQYQLSAPRGEIRATV